jgi:hypothetical protein
VDIDNIVGIDNSWDVDTGMDTLVDIVEEGVLV